MAIGDRPGICAEFKRGKVSPGGDAIALKFTALFYCDRTIGYSVIAVKMTVICFTNLKGGVGKSTLALHFIYWLSAIKKRSVAAVDADSQGSTSTWLEALEMDIKCHRIVDPDQLAEEIPQLESQTYLQIIPREIFLLNF